MDYIIQAILSNLLAVILLISILINYRRRIQRGRTEWMVFAAMFGVNILQCIIEPLTIILDGQRFWADTVICHGLNMVLFINTVLFAMLWAVYADMRTGQLHREKNWIRILKYFPGLAMLVATLVNIFTPVFFRITDDNLYQRTDLFILAVSIAYFYLLWGTISAYGVGQRTNRYVFLPALNFVLPILLTSAIQFCMPGISLMWAGSAVGLTSAYVSFLDESSAIDPLSGTFSRHHLNHYLKNLPRRSGSGKLVAGLMLDIDHFKSINDRYGHLAGDETIHAVGQILRRATYAGDALVFRYAGDEFTIITRISHDYEIAKLIEGIQKECDAYNRAAKQPFAVSLSIGHTVYVPGDEQSDFIKRMDDAMYEEKRRKLVLNTSGSMDFTNDYNVNPDRNCILIVDDDLINREIIKNLFPPVYSFVEADNGLEGLARLKETGHSLCAILLDMSMPEMDGMELLHILHDRGVTETIPTFLVTANEGNEIQREAYALGVMDVITKPVMPYVVLRRIQSVLELFQARESLRATVRGQEQQLRENADTIDTLHRNTIEALASAIEFRDVESGEHTGRIYTITKLILSRTEMGRGYSAEEIECMAVGSIMHDIGKIAISDVILNKPGRLTHEEYEEVKLHTVKGAALMEQLIKTQAHPSYRYACDIARHHHERWDGSGYPDGLRGDQISVWSQVTSIADVYDALVSPRVYKKAFPPDEAVNMICRGECGVFNPLLVECFLQVEPEIRRWYTEKTEDARADAFAEVVEMQREAPRDVINVLLLMAAVKSAYDMILSANLTRNTCTMIDHERFESHRYYNGGEFDDLIESAAQRVPDTHREAFLSAFSRDRLLEAYEAGTTIIRLTYPQFADTGESHMVSTTVILMEDNRTGDILGITLARYLDGDTDNAVIRK